MSQSNWLEILLVEDDQRLAELTKSYLEKQGCVVTWAEDGSRAISQALRHRFDVILLDLMLPGISGIEVCQKLRQRSDVPIIMITARGEEADRVLGLEIGADDYLPKPFSPRELLARIHACVRRARGQAGPAQQILQLDDLVLDPASHSARLDGKTLDLTAYEFSLLYALAVRAGRVLGREQIMELAGGNPDEAFDRSVDVHISRLRQKLKDNPKKPRRIRTVRGVGYQYMSQHKNNH